MQIKHQYERTKATKNLEWPAAAEANCMSTFLANRVAKIQENDTLKWSQVGNHDNRVDIALKAMDPMKLKSCSRSWSSPEWFITNIFPEQL